MLIYIRHGTSALGCKSAEKLNKAESVATSPRLCQVARLPDQRIEAIGKSDQKTGICLEGGEKSVFAWPFTCGYGIGSERSTERSATVLEPATTVTSPREQRQKQQLTSVKAPPPPYRFCCVFYCRRFVMRDHDRDAYSQENIKD